MKISINPSSICPYHMFFVWRTQGQQFKEVLSEVTVVRMQPEQNFPVETHYEIGQGRDGSIETNKIITLLLLSKCIGIWA